MISLLLALSIDAQDAQHFPVTAEEQLAELRITPAVPGGQPFDQTIDLPSSPEPGAMLLAAGGILLLGRRHAR